MVVARIAAGRLATRTLAANASFIMETCLVICRTPAGLPTLRRLRFCRPVIVVSDDPGVQEAARKQPGVRDTGFIERMESFYVVAADVRGLLEQINGWLTSFADPASNLFAETLSWGLNVEGGYTTQRVQNALLLIRSYLELFTLWRVAEVHVITEPDALWEDLVLFEVTRSRRLPCLQHPVQRLAIWRKIWWTRVRPLAVAGYYLANLARLGSARFSRPTEGSRLDGALVFQLCTSARNHVENVRPLMLSLKERGQRPIALCWTASDRYTKQSGAARLSADGLSAVRLERLLTFRDVLTDASLALRVAWRIWTSARTNPRWRELQFMDIALAPILFESLRHYLIAELPQRIRYQQALSTCLSAARPAAFKPWGGPESFEGRTALRLLTHRASTLVFHYWLGGSLEWPYADCHHTLDLFLAKGPHEACHAARDYALSPDQIKLVGQARFDGYAEFLTHTPTEVSRRRLNLPVAGLRYIGFDPNGVLRGLLTAREQIETTSAILRAVRGRSGVVVVIKPHPGYPVDHLKPLIAASGCENVVVLPRRSPVEHFLNAVDVIVTKFSTLILDAALMKRPAISVLLDGEDRFKMFGDMPAIVRSPLELEELLVELGDDAVYAKWRGHRLAKCEQLLPDFYYQTDRPAVEIAAEALCQRLERTPR
jgi:hypothetical protein